MAHYTRKQLKERWERAKKTIQSWDTEFAKIAADEVIPGLWEVRIFPRWIFKNFLDRKIFEPLDSADISRNVSYDPDSDDSQEWGWYRWTYYFDDKEGCYVLELDYDVKMEDKKALPLVRGILDLALVESADSIIGKFKWRIRWLRKIPILRRIPAIFLFYFEMKKIEDQDEEFALFAYGRETGREIDEAEAIRFPKASKSWGKVKLYAIFDPTKEGKCIAWLDTGEDETFSGEDDTCFQ